MILCTRESRRALEFQEEYEGATGQDIAKAMNGLTEWLWEGKGDPDDDVLAAKGLAQEFIENIAENSRSFMSG